MSKPADPYEPARVPEPRTILLRFSDAGLAGDDRDEPTISEHRALLETHGAVWWGWWKKDHEPDHEAVLAAFTPRLPEYVGLVNRKSERYYRVHCTAIESRAEAFECPEPELVPSYYRHTKHPAWLKLDGGIEEIDLAAWNAHFGAIGMPRGDMTLLWIEQPWYRVQFPAPPSIVSIDAPGSAVVHVSDLHYGASHGYAPTFTSTVDVPKMVDRVLEAANSEDAVVGVLVLSGDFITKAKKEDFTGLLPQELERLRTGLALEKHHLLMIPGNHDIPLTDWDDQTYAHENAFREFLEDYHGRLIRDLEVGARFSLPDGRILTFVGLNSVRLRKRGLEQYGYVGSQRSAPLLNELLRLNEGRDAEHLAADKVINFAVLHHHLTAVERVSAPEPNSDRPMTLTLDAGELIEDMQRSGVHIALHGHYHYPYLGSTGRGRAGPEAPGLLERPLWVIGAGSAGSSELATGQSNSINVYHPEYPGLRVRTWSYTRTEKPMKSVDVLLPLTDLPEEAAGQATALDENAGGGVG